MSDPENTLSFQLRAAAAALTNAARDPATAGLLHYLRYDDNDAIAIIGRIRLLQAAALFRRLFRLPMPDAPGLTFFGAEADPACLGPHNSGLPVGGFAGSGLDPRRAFESCVGEGIEYLSQFAQPDDPSETASLATRSDALDPAARGAVEAILASCGIPANQAIDWTQVRRLTDNTPSWFPTDLCLRRSAPDFTPPLKLSTGCAAGETREAATLRGLLELIERDAVALWWKGGRRPRSVPADSQTAVLLAQIRAGQGSRQTMLLDITTDLGVPVVAAFSTNPDGHDFALGTAARTTQPDAARSAIFEMCQSELSLHVIAVKQRESGQAALNESDRRQQSRAASLNPETCLLLRPDDDTSEPDIVSNETLHAMARRLAGRGITAWSIDLTHPLFEVPVVRVIAPALQPEPSKIISPRLARVIAETGGGGQHCGNIPIL
jgi:ribosomal protein S12 methylthiotransferase accessory factor